MKLYYFPGACSLADHIVLEWISAPYQALRMSHATVRSPEYLALNPSGTVPLLIDGAFVLTQNVAILTYLADLHPEVGLLGDGTIRGRAEVMKWLGFLNSDVHPAFKPIFAPGRYLSDAAYAKQIADTARAHARTHLGRINEQLAGRDWLTGERSVADPYLFAMFRWAVRLAIGIEALPHLSRFAERMYADPGVRRAIREEEDVIPLAA